MRAPAPSVPAGPGEGVPGRPAGAALAKKRRSPRRRIGLAASSAIPAQSRIVFRGGAISLR
jgi:hypothetical protein